MKSVLVCAAITLLAITNPVWAEENSPLWMGRDSIDGHSRVARTKRAKDMLALVNAFRAGLPLLRPSEAEWIAKEEAEIEELKSGSGYSERWGKLHYRSPEYQHQSLEKVLSQMREGLDCILDDKVALRREVFCWAIVSYHFAKEQDWERWIEVTTGTGRLSLSGLGAKPPPPNIVAGILAAHAQNIQAEIIIPYLRGDTFTR